MPSVPIEIIQVGASGTARYGVVSGRIQGQIRAGIKVTAEACHGIAIGIEPGVFGAISGQAQALLIGGSVQGQLTAQAGVKVMVWVNPNLFDSLGLTIEGGAYAFAAAAGRLGIYLTPTWLSSAVVANAPAVPSERRSTRPGTTSRSSSERIRTRRIGPTRSTAMSSESPKLHMIRSAAPPVALTWC